MSSRLLGTTRSPALAPAFFELLETRRFMSASPPGLDPRVYAPDAKVRGESLAQWSADWWSWIFSNSASANPLLDTTGAQAYKGNAGKVFFLAGTGFGSGPSITRNVTIPTGTPVLMPVLNSVADETEPDAVGPDHFPVAFLREEAAGFIGLPTATFGAASNTLAATLDGKSVSNLSSYREQSPVFGYTMPKTDNLWQLLTGQPTTTATPPAVSDGYWLMFQPLEKGTHTLTVDAHADTPFGSYDVHVTYHITVVSKGHFEDLKPSAPPPPKAILFNGTTPIHKKDLFDDGDD